jgi:hypothetical protein
MRWSLSLFLLCAGTAAYVYWPRAITEESLSAQLDGRSCHFAYRNACEQRGLEPLGRLLGERHDCDMWAVQCLAEFDTPQAQEVMIKVVSSKTDVETCDGTLPIRTDAVNYLGRSGDASALAPLEALLASKPTSVLSKGASGCEARPEETQVILDAIAAIKCREPHKTCTE